MNSRTCLLIAILALCAIVAFFAARNPSEGIDTQLMQAEHFYQLGENSKTPEEKEAAFNEALSGYLQLEKQYRPVNSKFYTNIGNTYFQLGQIPQAVLYYNRALAQEPRNPAALHNLAVSNEKLGLPPAAGSAMPVAATLYKLFALFAILAILLLSLAIWTGRGRSAGALSAMLSLALLCLLGYEQYFTPLYGVVIKASSLYLDADEHYSHVLEKPLPPGLKVEVLSDAKEETWFKVRTQEGSVGYVPQKALRVI